PGGAKRSGGAASRRPEAAKPRKVTPLLHAQAAVRRVRTAPTAVGSAPSRIKPFTSPDLATPAAPHSGKTPQEPQPPASPRVPPTPDGPGRVGVRDGSVRGD